MKKSVIFLTLIAIWSCGPLGSGNNEGLLTPRAFAEQLASGDYVLLDVRTPKEMQGGFVEGAKNLDYNSMGFESTLDTMDRERKYLVYCAVGKRSSKAVNMMKSKGFKNVSSMDGGLNAWVAAGLPVQKP